MTIWTELGKNTFFDQLTQHQQEKVTLFNQYTEGFFEIDKLVIANPLWNLHVPSRLKAWIDTVTMAKKAFRYTATRSESLLKNKKLLHIQANGGVFLGQDPARKCRQYRSGCN